MSLVVVHAYPLVRIRSLILFWHIYGSGEGGPVDFLSCSLFSFLFLSTFPVYMFLAFMEARLECSEGGCLSCVRSNYHGFGLKWKFCEAARTCCRCLTAEHKSFPKLLLVTLRDDLFLMAHSAPNTSARPPRPALNSAMHIYTGYHERTRLAGSSNGAGVVLK